MIINGHPIAVCSWSLQPESVASLVQRVRSFELSHLQIALAPLVELDAAAREREILALVESGLMFPGGMISFSGENYATIEDIRRTGGFVPDALWPERCKQISDALAVARALRLTAITTHVGFVPAPGKPGHEAMVSRIGEAAALVADAGMVLLLETGQESAEELKALLDEIDSPVVGINFDPANMILYGAGDPIAAIGVLGRWIRHVHVKDAIPSSTPGEQWGAEVPFGTGEVGARRFLAALRAVGYHGPLAIEREAGNQRDEDVRAAISAIRQASLHG